MLRCVNFGSGSFATSHHDDVVFFPHVDNNNSMEQKIGHNHHDDNDNNENNLSSVTLNSKPLHCIASSDRCESALLHNTMQIEEDYDQMVKNSPTTRQVTIMKRIEDAVLEESPPKNVRSKLTSNGQSGKLEPRILSRLGLLYQSFSPKKTSNRTLPLEVDDVDDDIYCVNDTSQRLVTKVTLATV